MKKKKVSKKVVAIAVIIIAMLCMPIINLAHSGRTDSNGGHRDNKNASGLGSYHYHCGGYPAHLHTGGVCPYTSSTTSVQSTQKSSSTFSKTTEVKASKIEIDVGDIELLIGESKILTATVSPSNAVDKTINWTSSDKEIVMVDSEGGILAVGIGEATITGKTSNGKIDSIKVTVSPIKVSEIIISENDIKLNVDENITLKADVLPEDATDKTVEWTTENPEIATIEDGVLTAVAEGTTKVICTSKDGIKAEANLIIEEVVNRENQNTVEVSVDAAEDMKNSTTEPSDGDTLLGLATLGAIVGVPAYIYNKKKNK